MVRAVQIDGGSRAPQVDTTYVGASAVIGTGVPGAYITVTWPATGGMSATPDTTVRVDSDGTRKAVVPEDVFLEVSDERLLSQLKATQMETAYGFDRGESYAGYSSVRGSTLKIIGSNARTIYYDAGQIPDKAEVLFFGGGLHITMGEGDGRYILTNSAVSNMNDAGAFESLWQAAENEHKGYLKPGSGTFWQQELCDIPANCTVWVMADIVMGGSEKTLFDAITYHNLYEREKISVRLVEGEPSDAPGELVTIKPYTVIDGNYGVPYDLSGTVLAGAGVRYNRVELVLDNYMSDYWTSQTKNGQEMPFTIVLDSGFPADYTAMSDDTEGDMYTLYMQRVEDLWEKVYLGFVDKEGNPSFDTTGEPEFIWIPMDIVEDTKEYGEDEIPDPPTADVSSSDFLLRGGVFTPLKHYLYSPVGYYVSTEAADVREDTGEPSKLNICADFSKDFNPEITDITAVPKEKIYIVYDRGITNVREVHKAENNISGASVWPDRISTAKIESNGTTVRYTAPVVLGHVPVGYEIRNLKQPYTGGFVYDPAGGHTPDMNQNGEVYADLSSDMLADGFAVGAPEEVEIVWIYAVDTRGNGIPDSEEVRIDVYWYGIRVDSIYAATLDSIRVWSRINEELVFTNDGSEFGSTANKLEFDSGPNKGVWFFDNEDADNLPIRSITPTSQAIQTINFNYVHSKNGAVPDNKQYVDIYYVLWDGIAEIDQPSDYLDRQYVFKGDIFTYTPAAIDLALGSQRIKFTYVPTVTALVIRCIDKNADPNDPNYVLTAQTITDAAVGQKISWRAPYIDNTWALVGDVLQVIQVAESANVITFEYEKVTGNITVLLVEEDAGGQIIRVMGENVTAGEKKTVPIPDLSSYYYTAISNVPVEVDYSGASPNPGTVEYYYHKEMMDATVRAVDRADGAELSSVTLTDAARMGESYTAVAPVAERYTLAGPSTRTVYADPTAGPFVIDFEYREDKVGGITVRHYYMDGEFKKVLSEYTVSAIVGSKFTASKGTFDGFSFDKAYKAGDGQAGSDVELIVAETSADNLIEFRYDDERVTVTIETKLGNGAATVYGVPERLASGTEKTVYAPYMSGYVLKGYTIQGRSEVTTGNLNTVTLGAVASSVKVTFRYVKIEDDLSSYTSVITVIGAEGTTEHYQYELTVAKNAAAFDVTANTLSGLKVVKAELDDADLGAVTRVSVDPADGSQTLVFTYASNMATVKIKAVYEGTLTPVEGFTAFTVDAEVGKSFAYAPLTIAGHTYKGAAPTDGKLDTVASSGNEIVFS